MSADIISIDRKPVERKCSFCKVKEKDTKTLFKSGLNDHGICGDCARKASTVVKQFDEEKV